MSFMLIHSRYICHITPRSYAVKLLLYNIRTSFLIEKVLEFDGGTAVENATARVFVPHAFLLTVATVYW